eukprot:scaffold312326_cov24-Attheya_sp.AAC.1
MQETSVTTVCVLVCHRQRRHHLLLAFSPLASIFGSTSPTHTSPSAWNQAVEPRVEPVENP